jgi:spermidine synthase
LPWIPGRWALTLLALPWLIIGVRPLFNVKWPGYVRVASGLLVPVIAVIILFSIHLEKVWGPGGVVLRDSTATVTATGTGMKKQLLVNGYGMTLLTPITKTMAHLPLAYLGRPPQNALVICFGMGTTFRALRTWGIPVTAAELVPSVPKLFWYFHSDAEQVMSSPLAVVKIDDGRRFLQRTSGKYDVITIDPPPPVEAAGSSLLYSKNFYTVVSEHLAPGGIFQQWLPNGDPQVVAAVALAVKESFPYVRVFRSVEGIGYHFLASNEPLPEMTAEQLAAKLPAAAAKDFVEWGPAATPEAQFELVVGHELSLDGLIAGAPGTPALSDDRPINEYYAYRRHLKFKPTP